MEVITGREAGAGRNTLRATCVRERRGAADRREPRKPINRSAALPESLSRLGRRRRLRVRIFRPRTRAHRNYVNRNYKRETGTRRE